ncbi:MAG TPA: helix-turn-helix-type transcriptional regulator [Porticoccaceae bacterium]|nr:helix-turn-helix-type transcriptional regulator [Porticoccaceae bacterium]
MASEALLPIREVARITGVNPVTLRAWQRRYGLIKPQRTEKGHRLYSKADIDLIREILYWLEQGVSIGKVKGLLGQDEHSVTEVDSSWEQARRDLLDSAKALTHDKLEKQLRELAKLYPTQLFLRRIVEPWLAEMATLPRPDRELIQHSAQAVLTHFIHQVLTIQSGPRIAVGSIGDARALSTTLVRYELQGMACRSIDLGQVKSEQLPLARSRLDADAYVLVLGSGLTGLWFMQHQPEWPEPLFLVGQLGNVYRAQGWLNKPFAQHVSDLEDFPPCDI